MTNNNTNTNKRVCGFCNKPRNEKDFIVKGGVSACKKCYNTAQERYDYAKRNNLLIECVECKDKVVREDTLEIDQRGRICMECWGK